MTTLREAITLHVTQDGGDFYVRDAFGVTTVSYPLRVKDWDLETAKVARVWFEQRAAPHVIIVWE